MVSATDALNHPSAFDYTDQFDAGTTDKGALNTWAFVTTATNPNSQQTTARYDYNLGLTTTSTDANSQSTTLTYDALGRPSGISFPDGGQTQYTYTASTGTITTLHKRAASQNIQSDQIFDGLGRPCETRLTEGGGNLIRTLMEYDGAGRVSRSSNPYRLTSSPSRCAEAGGEAFTTRQYDGIDRVTSVTAPDGAVTGTAFAGNKTTVSDPAVVKKDLITDALGRLTQVNEDPGGPKPFSTYYLHDALDNLTGVCPGVPFDSSGTCSAGRKRRFLYDSLSRLRQVENPETGGGATPTTYSYDNNGNLTARTDPRYTTSYTYDWLNRLTRKDYSASGAGQVTLCYDTASSCGGGAVANGIGRLIHVANDISTTRYNAYDPLGRVVSSTQTILNENPLTTSYIYDLAGDVTSMTYPSGRVVQTEYDGAGRAYKVSNVASTVTPYGEVSAFAQHGAIASLKLGWNPVSSVEVMTESWSYNNRLQPIETKLNLRGSTANVIRLGYFYCANQAPSCSSNNGNMKLQQIGNDAVGAETAWAVTQTYEYDTLNRLTVPRRRITTTRTGTAGRPKAAWRPIH